MTEPTPEWRQLRAMWLCEADRPSYPEMALRHPPARRMNDAAQYQRLVCSLGMFALPRAVDVACFEFYHRYSPELRPRVLPLPLPPLVTDPLSPDTGLTAEIKYARHLGCATNLFMGEPDPWTLEEMLASLKEVGSLKELGVRRRTVVHDKERVSLRTLLRKRWSASRAIRVLGILIFDRTGRPRKRRRRA